MVSSQKDVSSAALESWRKRAVLRDGKALHFTLNFSMVFRKLVFR
jgi:hypothetical protein